MKKIIILKMLTAAVLLQSCSNKYNSGSENLELASNSFTNSYGQDSNVDPRTEARVPITLPGAPAPVNPTPQPPPQNPPPQLPPTHQPISPHPQPPPPPTVSPVISTDCSADLAALNWSGLNSIEKVRVAMRPLDNYWAKEDGYPNEIYAYGGMGIGFENPYRQGSRSFFRHAPNYQAEGYSIQIKDSTTGLLVEALDSDLSRPHVWSAAGLPAMGFIKSVASELDSNSREQYNFVSYHFSRSLYDRIKNFRNATVSLYCKNVLVSEGIQDIQSLAVDMARTLVKVGTYQDISLYSYPANVTTGYVNVKCPLEIIAGSTLKCTAGGLGISSGYWLIDGQRTSQFSGVNPTALDLSSLSRGAHTAQLWVTYSNGITDRSNIHLIKIK